MITAWFLLIIILNPTPTILSFSTIERHKTEVSCHSEKDSFVDGMVTYHPELQYIIECIPKKTKI